MKLKDVAASWPNGDKTMDWEKELKKYSGIPGRVVREVKQNEMGDIIKKLEGEIDRLQKQIRKLREKNRRLKERGQVPGEKSCL